jgi:hypothetical protein
MGLFLILCHNEAYSEIIGQIIATCRAYVITIGFFSNKFFEEWTSASEGLSGLIFVFSLR